VHQFREAIEANDIEAAIALLAEDVVFHSPVVFASYRGRDTVATILRAVLTVFEDFHYVRELTTPDGADTALVFRTRVGERGVEGCDFIHTDAAGHITELTVMVRPMSGATALAEAMKAKLSPS
jgi:limonene-1,2-epoxide hydrolase